jgi:hypothetical protein
MIVIIGLFVLAVATVVGLVGVLSNAGPTHQLTETFSLLGYHVTGSTGTLFLFGIVVGAVGVLGLAVLLAGARRTAARGRDARRQLARSQRETAFINRDRADLIEHQNRSAADTFGASAAGEPDRPRGGLMSRLRGRPSAPAAIDHGR